VSAHYDQWLIANPEPERVYWGTPQRDQFNTPREWENALAQYDDEKREWEGWEHRRSLVEYAMNRGNILDI